MGTARTSVDEGARQTSVELRLPAEPIAPALARAGIQVITDQLPERAAVDVTLLTTELVSNAVRHAARSAVDDVTLRITVDALVRVDVVDCGALFEAPTPTAPWEAHTSGWGLFLVDKLSRAWGIEEEPSGKRVWFELDPSDE
jgi:anti-sigma regulatory factor (Ser/Thr protein kinase)